MFLPQVFVSCSGRFDCNARSHIRNPGGVHIAPLLGCGHNISSLMATKAPELSISDLADVLAALIEVTKPYQLGIQLRIDLAELDTIEKNHPGDIDRQKTEVIKYWLRNSPDASWTTLANAVERVGGHARLVERLREEQSSEKSTKLHLLKSDVSCCIPHEEASTADSQSRVGFKYQSFGICGETCEDCSVLLLGMMGHGKSTLGNKILNYDGCLKINDRECPQTRRGSATLYSASQHKNYEVTVYDHDGLFEGPSSINTLPFDIPVYLNLVIFVLKQGRTYVKSEREKLEAVITKFQINGISAPVLTHCEHLSEEEREKKSSNSKGIIHQLLS